MRLADELERHADRVLAFGDDGRSWHYGAALELGEAFRHEGLARRLVLCLCGNDAASLLGYLALLRAGGIPALLSPTLPPDALRELVSAYRPAYLWLPAARRDEFPTTRVVATFEGHVLLADPGAPDLPLHDDLALLLSTSGSTGSPVFVRQSARNVDSNAEAIGAYLGITPDERPITTLPLSYTYGLSIVHSHVRHGCTIALTDRSFFDRGFWEFIRSSGATSLGGVPYHYEMLAKLRFWRMTLPGLRTLTQAGGRMEPSRAREIATECAARGIAYYTMYGQAEATARMAYLPPERAIDKAGSIGGPIPGGVLWLEDDDGQPIDTPEVAGELVYRGDNVTLGYARGHADLARGDDNHGVLRTGDVAQRDADGDYTIVGRRKRFLKLFGHRTNLQDLDDALTREGHEAACGGSDDHLRVYLAGQDADGARAIKDAVVARLRVHPSAVAVVGVDALPRSDAGKVRYGLLDSLDGKVLA
ncbi:MAG: AMP-binding protein [Rhodocyclaceae bacterium]|nr:AMP-binding protein [Rhodocyclaceae bacterium]